MRGYDQLIADLEKAKDSIRGVSGQPVAGGPELITEVQMCLRNYCDPWVCADCGHTAKIPENDAAPNVCPKCRGESVIAYGYMEQHRLSFQINKLLRCVQRYARVWIFGYLAKKCLATIHHVPTPKYKGGLQKPS